MLTKIGNFKFENNKCFVIAEIGINHNGNIETAKQMIKLAKESGANAVKFQSFKAEKLVKKNSEAFNLFKNLELNKKNHKELFDYCKKLDILFLSTPFDIQGVELLEDLGVLAYKIASSDVTNIPLIQKIAKTKKPIILSTGMANLQEIKTAYDIIKEQGNNQIAILHCVSLYPTNFDEVNLKSIPFLKSIFSDCIIGYSDHTIGITIPVAAVSLGARIIEKHFTYDNNAPGPDHKISLNYKDFKTMINHINIINKALGELKKEPTKREKEILVNGRTSILAAKNIKKGEKLTIENIIIKRPSTGIEPKYYNIILGKTINKNIKQDNPITWEDLLN